MPMKLLGTIRGCPEGCPPLMTHRCQYVIKEVRVSLPAVNYITWLLSHLLLLPLNYHLAFRSQVCLHKSQVCASFCVSANYRVLPGERREEICTLHGKILHVLRMSAA